MFPLAALVAGNPAQGYQDSRKRQQSVDTGDVEAQGQAAAGNAYMGMFGGQQTPGAMPGQQPGAPGGQPPQQQNLLATLLQKLRGMPQQPPSPGGMPPGGAQPPPSAAPPGAPPSNAMVPGAQPVASPGPMPGQQPQPPGQPGPQMGQPSLPAGQPGQLNWQSVVQAVVKANPGVKDPRVIAAAVDRFLPLMSQQTQQQWREMSLMLRQQQLDISEERARTAADQGAQRIDQAGKRLDQGDRRLDLSGKREERLERDSILRNDQQHSMFMLRRQQLEQQITASKDRAQLGQWRALLDAEHKRAIEIITSQSAGMDPKERKRLLEEQGEFYNDQIEMMKNNMEGQSSAPQPGGAKSVKTESIKPGTPTKVQTPADVAKLPKGTRYVTPDGQTGTAPGPTP